MSSRTILYYNEHFLISLRNVERLPLVSFHIALSELAGFCGCVVWFFAVHHWRVAYWGSPLSTFPPHTLTSATHTPGWVTFCIRVTLLHLTSQIVLITTTTIIIVIAVISPSPSPPSHHHHHITTIIVIAIISPPPSPSLSPSSLASPHFCCYGCSSSPLIGKSSCHLWKHIDIIAHSADF